MDKFWLPPSVVAQAFETGAWGAPSESLDNYENHRKQQFNIMKSAAGPHKGHCREFDGAR